MDGDDFFEQLTRFQSKRMDDQRCSLTVGEPASSAPDPLRDDLIDLIAGQPRPRPLTGLPNGGFMRAAA